MSQSKRKTVSLFMAVLFVTGCAGQATHPVSVNQYGDTVKSCKAIESEVRFLDAEVSRRKPATENTGRKVTFGVAGAYFPVPWLFTNLSKAEQKEINGLRQKHNDLIILAGEKNCERTTL